MEKNRSNLININSYHYAAKVIRMSYRILEPKKIVGAYINSTVINGWLMSPFFTFFVFCSFGHALWCGRCRWKACLEARNAEVINENGILANWGQGKINKKKGIAFSQGVIQSSQYWLRHRMLTMFPFHAFNYFNAESVYQLIYQLPFVPWNLWYIKIMCALQLYFWHLFIIYFLATKYK